MCVDITLLFFFSYVPGAEISGEQRRRNVEWWKVFPAKLHT